MQAIARVNHVFKEKAGGVVVDYIGILESLKSALKQYTDSDRGNTGIDTDVAINVMLEKLEILQNMFHGYGYFAYMGKSQVQRMRVIAEGMDFILEKTEEEQKEFNKITVELSKAYSLCATTEVGGTKTL
jgi:type I restriction enzyme R subunit